MISEINPFGQAIYDYSLAGDNNARYEINEGELRTARVGVSAKLFGRVKLKAELAVNGSGEIIPTDAFVEWKINAGGPKIRVGQFKTPNSFDEQTSGRFTSTRERAAFTDAFELDRRVGIAITQKVEDLTLTFGVFGQNIIGQQTFRGYAIAGRVTYAKDFAGDLQLHIGGSFRYRGLDESQTDFSYRQRPYIHTAGRILTTGKIARSDIFAGVEAVVTKGRFWAASEYAVTFSICPSCQNDPVFSGGYLESGVMFGGERKLSGGRFDRPMILRGVHDRGLGALALVARLDAIDLNDAGVAGGGFRSATIGVDWWPTAHVRLGVNGFVVDNKFGNVNAGLDPVFAAAVLNGIADTLVTGVNLRAQFDF